VANIYVDIAAVINGNSRENLPTASDGLRSMAAVYAAPSLLKILENGQTLDLQCFVDILFFMKIAV
jgi:hypothetical protein